MVFESLQKVCITNQKANVPDVRPLQSRSRCNRITVALKPPDYRISAEATLALLREGHQKQVWDMSREAKKQKKESGRGSCRSDEGQTRLGISFFAFITWPPRVILVPLFSPGQIASLLSSGNNSRHFFDSIFLRATSLEH